MLILTGCIKRYDFSEEVSDSATEYMAELLLKYDDAYDYGLTPADKLNLFEDEDNQETEKPEDQGKEDLVGKPTTTPNPNLPQGDSDDEVTKKYTLSQVIGEQGFEIQYSGYEIMEDFTDANFSLTPISGNQLLVVSFTIKNISDQKKELNLIEADISYQLDINIGTIHKPQLTFKENDLQYIKLTLGAGKSENAILIFQISKKIDISQINLIASKEERTEIIELK